MPDELDNFDLDADMGNVSFNADDLDLPAKPEAKEAKPEPKKAAPKKAAPAPAPVAVPTGNVNLTATDLKDIIAAAVSAAITESKKKHYTEEELKAIEQAQEERKSNAADQLQEIENKRNEQRNCTHIRRDGTCRAVYVKNGNFMICQKCAGVVMPESQRQATGNMATVIYDTQLFVRLYQQSGSGDTGVFA